MREITKEDFLTVKQLEDELKRLRNGKYIDDDTIIVLSSDSEGNSFGCPNKKLVYSYGIDYDLSYNGEKIGSNLVIFPLYENLEDGSELYGKWLGS